MSRIEFHVECKECGKKASFDGYAPYDEARKANWRILRGRGELDLCPNCKKREEKLQWAKEKSKRRKVRTECEAMFPFNLSKRAKDEIWDMAWRRGHRAGYEEVKIEYDEIAELVATIVKECRDV